ncbi:hypothetical protein GCM10027395_16130 [Giesbergeria sinuosa]
MQSMSVSPLSLQDRRLLRQLVWAVVLKLMVLTLLWWCFIDGQKVAVDDGGMAAQILQPPHAAPAQGHFPSKESI